MSRIRKNPNWKADTFQFIIDKMKDKTKILPEFYQVSNHHFNPFTDSNVLTNFLDYFSKNIGISFWMWETDKPTVYYGACLYRRIDGKWEMVAGIGMNDFDHIGHICQQMEEDEQFNYSLTDTP